MSVRDAMRFIQAIEKDEHLKDSIRSRGCDVALEELAELAAQMGFEFTVEEFRAAFAKDWTARWSFYSARAAGRT